VDRHSDGHMSHIAIAMPYVTHTHSDGHMSHIAIGIGIAIDRHRDSDDI